MAKLLVVSPVDLGPELGKTVLWRPSVERFSAADADAAVEMARRTGPSLIVVDGFDPGGAAALVGRLRQDSLTRPSAIAVLSRCPASGTSCGCWGRSCARPGSSTDAGRAG